MTKLPYRSTRSFSPIVLDYIDGAGKLSPFYSHKPALSGLKGAIAERKSFNTDRKVLVDHLKEQYKGIQTSAVTDSNISLLLSENTFTITTAHQPNLLTGPLYFIYKIVHAIRLAESCKTMLPQYDFVPVYYMGNEDADFDELGHFFCGGEKRIWETKQRGAFGRLKVDKQLMKLIASLEGFLGTKTEGKKVLELISGFYKEGETIQRATLNLVNHLFSEYGLVVLIPDSAILKNKFAHVIQDELVNHASSAIVEVSGRKLEELGYKVQAHAREINLFYLEETSRERIEQKDQRWKVNGTGKIFNEAEILKELEDHPDKFSPNVILRGLYQETILPNIIFIGGGGEIAYWLQLKGLFERYKIPFPVLVLRNSFLIVNKRSDEIRRKLELDEESLFMSSEDIINQLVRKESGDRIKLNGHLTEATQFYDNIRKKVSDIDVTLSRHVDALKAISVYKLQQLEKKMLRAEKRKAVDTRKQVMAMKEKLFPNGNLQERVDNFIEYYAETGDDFIRTIYENSGSFEQEFGILKES